MLSFGLLSTFRLTFAPIFMSLIRLGARAAPVGSVIFHPFGGYCPIGHFWSTLSPAGVFLPSHHNGPTSQWVMNDISCE